jgi:hypothetical protein
MNFSKLILANAFVAALVMGIVVVDLGQAGPGLKTPETQAKWNYNADGKASPALEFARSGSAGFGKWNLQLAKSGGVAVTNPA